MAAVPICRPRATRINKVTTSLKLTVQKAELRFFSLALMNAFSTERCIVAGVVPK